MAAAVGVSAACSRCSGDVDATGCGWSVVTPGRWSAVTAFQWKRRRTDRRGWPIHAYVGPNGGGKSLAMVWDTMPSLSAGRRVLSTVRLLDWENPRLCDDPLCEMPNHDTHMAAHTLYVPLTRWEQVLDAESCDVLLDEVTGVASSRASHSMPAPVLNLLVQLRRKDVVCRWSSVSWARADLVVRETTQAVTYCRGYLPKAAEQTSRDVALDRVWRHRRMAHWRTYDATEFEDFTAGKREAMKPLTWDLHWIPGSPARLAYDTYDSVSTVGDVADNGRCVTCGGRRTAPACSCLDYVGSRGKSSRGAPAQRGGETVPSPVDVARLVPLSPPVTLTSVGKS